MRVRNANGDWEVVSGDETYTEWYNRRKAEDGASFDAYMKKGKNMSADKKQYEEYKKVLGKDAPSSFTNFQTLKYNTLDQWEYTKGLKNYLVKYPDSNRKYYDFNSELKEEGTLKRGVLVKSEKITPVLRASTDKTSEHIFERMEERAITEAEMLETVNSASAMIVQWKGQRRVYISKNASVVVTREGDDWVYKTAWKSGSFDDADKRIVEVLYGTGS